jgi:hypothetical protein
MRRIVFAVLSACVLVALAVLASPAKAGDDYEDGYHRHRHSGNVSYSSSCCYRKVVRHERSVRYVREDIEDRPYHRNGYYDRSSYRSSYYERPSYRSSYSDRPYYRSRYYDDRSRYADDGYVSRRYVSDYSGDSSYADNCYRRRVRVEDGRGGWVWGVRSSCD